MITKIKFTNKKVLVSSTNKSGEGTYKPLGTTEGSTSIYIRIKSSRMIEHNGIRNSEFCIHGSNQTKQGNQLLKASLTRHQYNTNS
jgi:hypothetical protein